MSDLLFIQEMPRQQHCSQRPVLRPHWSSCVCRMCTRTDDNASCHRPPKAGATALTWLPPSPTNRQVLLLPAIRKLRVEGKYLWRKTLGSSAEYEKQAPGRRWRRDPRRGRVQAGGGSRCRPGHRTAGRRDVTGGDTTFPNPEAAPLCISAKAAADGASSGQRLLRCQQPCAARAPPHPGRQAAPARGRGCAPAERGQGRGRGGRLPWAGGCPRSPPGCLRGWQLRQRCQPSAHRRHQKPPRPPPPPAEGRTDRRWGWAPPLPPG